MVDVAGKKQTHAASDMQVVTKKRGKGGKFISSRQFGKRKFFGEHVNNDFCMASSYI